VHRCDVSAAGADTGAGIGDQSTISHFLNSPTSLVPPLSSTFPRSTVPVLTLFLFLFRFLVSAPHQVIKPATSPPSCHPNPASSPSSDPPHASQRSRRCSPRDNAGTSSPAERILPIPIRTIRSLQRLRGCEWAEHPVAPFLRRSAVWILVFSAADRGRRLLDPSCSGSGIVNRLDYLLEDGAYDSCHSLVHPPSHHTIMPSPHQLRINGHESLGEFTCSC
jgi:hypothetical protein